MFKYLYNILRKIKNKIWFCFSINWVNTLYFNFKMLPFSIAKKLPVVFYGKVKFTSLKGSVIINAPIKFGMVGFGQRYEMITVSKKNAQLGICGTFIINGHIQFGIDYVVIINKNAILEMGDFSSLGGNGKIICTQYIKFGDFARVGFESQIIDSNFHKMKNVVTNELAVMSDNIYIGDYNYVGNRVSIMNGTITPNYCTITSSSLCNKDFSNFGKYILIGGIPAKFIKNNITRSWDEEMEGLKESLTINMF